MATDQKISTIDPEPIGKAPVIENEIPTYRAISGRAIASVVCGVLSACCLAHPYFYAFSIVAIGLGIWAHVAIRRYPDMLTGQRLASAGIALGLIFGLASGTISLVQYTVRSRQATRFAKHFTQVLERADKGEMFWYNAYPERRKGKTSEEVLQALESGPKERMMAEMSLGPLAPINKVHARLSSTKDQHVRFVQIEGVGEEEGTGAEMQVWAAALYEIEGTPTKNFPKEREYTLAILKARPKGRQYEWWVESMVYPYVPKTYVPTPKPVGDGHDHGGGGHH